MTNLGIITIKRNLRVGNEVSNKKYVDDELNKNTILRFIGSLQNYLKVAVAYADENFTKSHRKQVTDTRTIKKPNHGGYLLQKWIVRSHNKNNAFKKNRLY